MRAVPISIFFVRARRRRDEYLARSLVLGFELADHSLGLLVEGREDLVGVRFHVVKSQAADARSTTS
jgi:ribosomal protein S12